jgi:DNA gyrase subunit A
MLPAAVELVVRGVAEVVEGKKGRHQIVITEIPYALNKESLVIKIADLVHDKKIAGISDIRDDESARGNVRIVIDLKRDAYPKKLLNQLYKLTPLQTSFHYNMMALDRRYTAARAWFAGHLSEHIKHRQQVVRRRTEFELRKATRPRTHP